MTAKRHGSTNDTKNTEWAKNHSIVGLADPLQWDDATLLGISDLFVTFVHFVDNNRF